MIKKYLNILNISLLILTFLFLTSCNIYKSTDAREIPTDGLERARKNVEEGRGFSLKNLGDKKTNYEFASSNPMWRASLEILNFLPLTTVDYSGGVIITDWYNDTLNSSESVKISIQFLSNEIRTDSLNISVHKKTCLKENNCSTMLIDSQIKSELITSILKRASVLEKEKAKN